MISLTSPNAGTIKPILDVNHRYLQLFSRSVRIRCQITISRKVRNLEKMCSSNSQPSREAKKLGDKVHHQTMTIIAHNFL